MNIQKITLEYRMTDEVRALVYSRMMRRPLDIMQYKVDQIINPATPSNSTFNDNSTDPIQISKDKIKYMIYSAHDDQIDNIMVWLNATNVDFYTVLFSSQVQFELTYDDDCVTGEPTENCFSVTTIFNGQKLDFDGCESGCSYPAFKAYMTNIWYKGKDSDNLNTACDQNYTPHYPEFMFTSGNYKGFLQ